MKPLRKNLGVALHFGKRLVGEVHRRGNCRGVARVAARRLNMLEDRAYHRRLAVRHSVDIKLDRMFEELVDENRLSFRRGDCL